MRWFISYFEKVPVFVARDSWISNFLQQREREGKGGGEREQKFYRTLRISHHFSYWELEKLWRSIKRCSNSTTGRKLAQFQTRKSCGRARRGRNERPQAGPRSLRKISRCYPARRPNIISPRKDPDESVEPGLFNDACIFGARQV